MRQLIPYPNWTRQSWSISSPCRAHNMCENRPQRMRRVLPLLAIMATTMTLAHGHGSAAKFASTRQKKLA